jgi:DNA-binding response OmpR family regulator
MNILIVEDEKFILDSMAKALRGENYTVYTADDQDVAMNFLRTKKIDMVISDIMLPYAGGFDIVDFIREESNMKDIPIILVTGMDEDVLKTTHTRANMCLTKPFSSQQLIALVNKYLHPKADLAN